jgi:hypothetical protein
MVHVKGVADGIDIGEFPNAEEASNWAKLRYGNDLESVNPVYSTQATGIDPIWLLVFLLAIGLMSKRKGG